MMATMKPTKDKKRNIEANFSLPLRKYMHQITKE